MDTAPSFQFRWRQRRVDVHPALAAHRFGEPPQLLDPLAPDVGLVVVGRHRGLGHELGQRNFGTPVSRLHLSLLAKHAFENVLVDGERVLPEDRVAQLLELLADFVVDPWVVVIRPGQHHHADALFALELVQDFASLPAEPRVKVGQGFEALLNRPLALVRRQVPERA